LKNIPTKTGTITSWAQARGKEHYEKRESQSISEILSCQQQMSFLDDVMVELI